MANMSHNKGYAMSGPPKAQNKATYRPLGDGVADDAALRAYVRGPAHVLH